jgi:hypothetical protein
MRVLDAPSEADRDLDLQLLAIAVRGVVRAATFGQAVADRDNDTLASQRIATALAGFESRLPHGKDVRDVLEHFDDYRLGQGHLQKKDEMGDLLQWTEDDGTGPVLVIGGRYRLPGATAAAAAGWLANEVAQTFHDECATSQSPR